MVKTSLYWLSQIIPPRTSITDSKYRCAFNRLHVKDAAYLIAIINIAYFVSSFVVFGLITPEIELPKEGLHLTISYAASGSNLLFSTISIFVCAGVIYADKYNDPAGYLPYLLYFGSVIIALTYSAILFSFTANFSWDQYPDLSENVVEFLKSVILQFELLLVIFDLIIIYFWYIVYKAYDYRCNMVGQVYCWNPFLLSKKKDNQTEDDLKND